jgi:hypothetical protein|tara:strand:+ start:2471 stop:2860 length:390 start_codon:yes stop_codon:yes gene_type:complete
MSELIEKIVKELLDDNEFVESCKTEIQEIMKDGKFDFKDMPEVIALVVLVYEKYDKLHVEQKDLIEVFRLLIVELLKKLNFMQESNDEINKMLESCLTLLVLQVKTKSFWTTYFGWCFCACCKKSKCCK